MAGFGQEMQTFNPSLQFQDLDMQMEVINQFAEQNPSFLESLNFGGFSIETCSSSLAHHHQQQPLFQTSYYAHSHSNLPRTSHPNGSKPMPVQAIASAEDDFHQRKRRKVIEQPKSRFSSISPTASAAGSGGNCSDNSKKKSLGKEKRVVRREKEHEEFEEFIHVRARRGQATDSHSLAERVRRAKINNKLKCLQNIVPGCHKTMGMAGTLDEIINYVHSLQNQVEFLSMELAAASSCYGLNSITEDAPKAQVMQECDLMQECKVSAIDRSLAQRGTNSHEEQEMDQLFRDRFGEKTCYGSTWTL